MQQNATPETDRACGLSPAKATAVESLLAGSTVTETALVAGVDRSTLYRWLRDPLFLATYNGRRAEMREAAEAKLLKLQTKALEAVERALDEGDSRRRPELRCVGRASWTGRGRRTAQTTQRGSQRIGGPRRESKNWQTATKR